MKKSKLFGVALAACALWLPILLVACGDKGGNGDPSQGDGGYYITFDPNGGTLVGATVVKTGADGKIAVENFPTATHATEDFDGWFTERESGERVDHTYVFSAADTVYAHFSPRGSGDDGNGGNVGGDSAFGAVTLSSDGVLQWNKIKGATKYVLFVTFPGAAVADEFVLSKDSVSKDLKILKDGGFPSGRSIVELKAYHMVTVDIGGVDGAQEVPMSGVEDSFRVTKLNGEFSLERLKYSDDRLTLNGFYAEKQGNDKDGYYYLYEQILTNNKAMRFKINDRVKPTSGHAVAYYKSKAARDSDDATQIWDSNELMMGYPQINHGNNMYYARVINSETNEHYDYDLCVRGLYRLTVTRYNRTFTTSGGLRTNTDTPMGSAVEYTEGEIIAESALYDGIKTGSIGRDSGYNVIERGDLRLSAPKNAYPDMSNKVAVDYYFYGENDVRADCAEYAAAAEDFALGESDAGWTLNVGATADVDEVTVPAILIGKKVLSASFFMSTVKKIIIAEGATAFNVTFSDCNSITDIYLPSTIATMPANAFGHGFGSDLTTTATIHCAFSREYADANFDVKWNYIAGTFKTYNTVYGDSAPIAVDGLRYKLVEGKLTVIGVAAGFSGVVPDTALLYGVKYPVTGIEGLNYDGTIEIGKNVNEIAVGAFSERVESIAVADGNREFVVQNGMMFTADISRVIVAVKSEREFVLDETVTTVDKNAFSGGGRVRLFIKKTEENAGYEVGGDNIITVYGVTRVLTDGVFRGAELNDGSAVIVEYVGDPSATDIVIPSVLGGAAVKRVAYGTFADYSNMVSLVIPDSVERIDVNVIGYQNKLESVTLPFIGTSIDEPARFETICARCNIVSVTVTRATALAEHAFTYRPGYPQDSGLFPALKNITLPNTLSSIGRNAFWQCDLQYYEIGGAKYLGNDGNRKLVLIGLTDNSVSNFEIDDNVKIIYDGAFSAATNLSELVIPQNVTCVGYRVLPQNGEFAVTVNGDCDVSVWDKDWNEGFAGNISVGHTAVSADGAFKYSYDDNGAVILKGLQPETIDLIIPATVDGHKVTGIALGAFVDYVGVVSLELPVLGDGDENTHLGYMFGAKSAAEQQSYMPVGLHTVVVGNNVTDITANAFYGCTITELTVPFVGIGSGASSGNGGQHLGAIFGIKINGLDAFDGAAEITVDNGVSKKTYYLPESLKKVTVTNARTIYSYAFYGCRMLTDIIIEKLPDEVSGYTVGSYAFYGCTELANVKLPANAKYNGSYSIFNKACAKLARLELPLCGKTLSAICGATKIADSAAQYVKYVKVSDNESVADGAFQGMSELLSVEISGSTSRIGQYAFDGCVKLESVVLPESVTTIDMYAMKNCGALVSVTFGNTAGWTVSSSRNPTAVAVSASDLINTAKAAELMKSTYLSYTWKRS